MPEPIEQDGYRMRLARAFLRAWKDYYIPDRRNTISEAVARSSLAKHLVEISKMGVKEESALAESGLMHLLSLTPGYPLWTQYRIEGNGRFLRQWYVQLSGPTPRGDI